MPASTHLIGLIADTHGLVRPEYVEALQGVELILHAGDVGGHEVLHVLEQVAPVLAVAGNIDPPGDLRLPDQVEREIGGISVHVSHGNEVGRPTPARLVERYGADVLVFGHTHRAVIERIGGQLIVNPGAAGPRRFSVVASVAHLTIAGGHASAVILPLEV